MKALNRFSFQSSETFIQYSSINENPVQEDADRHELIVLQISDSAFPTGGFAHSGGLEAALKWGRVSDQKELTDFVSTALIQTSVSCLHFIRRIHHNDSLQDTLEDCNAFLSNHIANEASRCQGYALLNTAAVVFPVPSIKATEELIESKQLPPFLSPVFGEVTRDLGFTANRSCRLFLFLTLRNLLSSAVRLGIVGPLQGQMIQHDFGPLVQRLARPPLTGAEPSAVQTSPLQDLMQASHDRIYSRLFRS